MAEAEETGVEVRVGVRVGLRLPAAVDVEVGVDVGVAVLFDFKWRTASPENGAVRVRAAPPLIVPPLLIAAVAGLNHSTDKIPCTAVRFTFTLPPEGK